MGPCLRRDDDEDGLARYDASSLRISPRCHRPESGRSSIPETPVLESRSRGVLDRPVEPGDNSVSGDAASHSRDMIARALHFVPPSFLKRAQGKPGADRTHGSRVIKNAGGRTTGVTGNYPAFPARWVTAYFVLSPARLGLFVTVSAKTLSRFAKRHLPLGRQDHTTSPSASHAFVSGMIRVHRISPQHP